MLSAIELARMNRAIKLHFEGSFDALKYRFMTPMKRETFEKAKGHYHFDKLARRGLSFEDAKDFFVANALVGKTFILSLDEDAYRDYKRIKEALPYHVDRAMTNLLGDGASLEESIWTLLPKAVLQNRVHLVVASVIFWQFGGTAKTNSPDIISWPTTKAKIDLLYPILADKLDWVEYQKVIGKSIQKHYASI